METVKISDLKPGLRNLSLKVKAISQNEIRDVTSRKDGSSHKVTEELVGDETGTVLLTLWDDKINEVEEGKTYELSEVYTSIFKNNLRINVGRQGEIKESEDEIADVDESNAVSEKYFDQPPRYRRGGGYGGGGYGGRRFGGSDSGGGGVTW